MPDASQAFAIVVPAGNGVATPAETDLNIGLAEVVNCIITWPAGCVGLVGVALLSADTWAFPFIQDTYFTFEDFIYRFGVSNKIQTGDWSIMAYNTDYYDHTITVVLEYDYVYQPASQSQSLQVSA